MNDVLLASHDEEFCLVSWNEALLVARQLARDEQTTIFLRDPTTDRIYKTVRPMGQ